VSDPVVEPSLEVEPSGALSGANRPLIRRGADLQGAFLAPVPQELLQAEVYRVYENVPSDPGGLVYGTTVIQPGTVRDEYFMTLGHYHTDPSTGELYFGINGTGMVLLQTKTEVRSIKLEKNGVVYIPGGFAHRAVNTSESEPLVFLFCYPQGAGHDYARIRDEGWRLRVMRNQLGKTVVTLARP
jgi:glucose-6-phosphate isomerase